MNNNDDHNNKHPSADDLINDYLDDIFGHSSPVVDLIFPSNKIRDGLFLIPTLNPYGPVQTNKLRSQDESLLILLINLYFLRRPLPPRVRKCFLDLSEQVIDDYHAGQWIKETRSMGALSEV